MTIDTAALSDEHEQIECAGECLAEILVRVLGPHFHGKLCVCGLGNRELPADSLGPEVTSRLPLNLIQLAQGYDCRFREVCSFTPGVFGINNVRTDTLVAGAVQAMEPTVSCWWIPRDTGARQAVQKYPDLDRRWHKIFFLGQSGKLDLPWYSCYFAWRPYRDSHEIALPV
ncbi:MAG: GPR endopeptidase [Oscillospiraceae bacterium]